MNIKELTAHVNDNVQNDRNAGDGLLAGGLPSGAHSIRDIMWEEPSKYELSPKMVLINGIECVAGMTEAPKVGSTYFIASSLARQSYERLTWFDQDVDTRCLKLGVVFSGIEEGMKNAIAMGRAMVNFGEVT